MNRAKAILVIAWSFGCSLTPDGTEAVRKPNVFFIAVDDLRPILSPSTGVGTSPRRLT